MLRYDTRRRQSGPGGCRARANKPRTEVDTSQTEKSCKSLGISKNPKGKPKEKARSIKAGKKTSPSLILKSFLNMVVRKYLFSLNGILVKRNIEIISQSTRKSINSKALFKRAAIVNITDVIIKEFSSHLSNQRPIRTT
jgi:hypothetical protein